MRLLEEFKDRDKAREFSDYLYAQGIENKLREEGKVWELWVLDETQLEDSERMLKTYLNDSDHAKYKKAVKSAREKRKGKEEEKKEFNKKMHTRQRIFSNFQISLKGSGFQLRSVTGVLIICSVLITLLSLFGKNQNIINPFLITKYRIEGSYIVWNKVLIEIFQGQVWRLITPIFIHFGFIHILFNMLWLFELGTMIEQKKGSFFIILMITVVAVASNLGQFFISGPSFGGMSGVVYGLFGYIWMQSKFDSFSGMYIQRRTVIMMVAWFFLCLTGIFGNIANGAHAIGLIIGIAWGYLAAKNTRRK